MSELRIEPIDADRSRVFAGDVEVGTLRRERSQWVAVTPDGNELLTTASNWRRWKKAESAALALAEAHEPPAPSEDATRVRDGGGRFTPDDPLTPDVNEAWVEPAEPEAVEAPDEPDIEAAPSEEHAETGPEGTTETEPEPAPEPAPEPEPEPEPLITLKPAKLPGRFNAVHRDHGYMGKVYVKEELWVAQPKGAATLLPGIFMEPEHAAEALAQALDG